MSPPSLPIFSAVGVEVVDRPARGGRRRAGLLQHVVVEEHAAGIEAVGHVVEVSVDHHRLDEGRVDVIEVARLQRGHVLGDVVVQGHDQLLARHELESLGSDADEVGCLTRRDERQDLREEVVPVGALDRRDLQRKVLVDLLDLRLQGGLQRVGSLLVAEVEHGQGAGLGSAAAAAPARRCAAGEARPHSDQCGARETIASDSQQITSSHHRTEFACHRLLLSECDTGVHRAVRTEC